MKNKKTKMDRAGVQRTDFEQKTDGAGTDLIQNNEKDGAGLRSDRIWAKNTKNAENQTSESASESTPETSPEKLPEKMDFKRRFSAKRMAFMAVFVALSYAVSLLEIPLPIFGAEFLKLDFGNVFIVLVSFLLGPFEGVIVCLLKESLRLYTTTSGGAGEIANFIVTSVYLLFPAILYRYKKGLKSVCLSLAVACVAATGAALMTNRFLIFPAYSVVLGGSIFGMSVAEAFSAFWTAILLFNLIKTALITLLTLLLYKRLSNFLKKMKI